MTVSYSSDLKTTRMQAVINRIDVGSAGTLEICSAAYAQVLATLQLPKPSFVESGGVITLQGTPLSDTDADAGGTAAVARIKASNGDVVISGLTVGVGTGDIQVNSLSISQHQTVTITSGTITHAT